MRDRIAVTLMSTRKRIERLQIKALFERITQLGYDSPTAIQDSERPDFILKIGDKTVGLETTFAVYQEYVRAERLHHTVCPKACIDVTTLKDRERRRSNDEILSDIRTIGGPWQDEEDYMIDWRVKVAQSLQAKRMRLNQPGFQLFDENWLLIQDEPGLADDVDFTNERARRHLAIVFCGPTTTTSEFDTVFVSSRRHLFRWSGNRLTLNYKRS